MRELRERTPVPRWVLEGLDVNQAFLTVLRELML